MNVVRLGVTEAVAHEKLGWPVVCLSQSPKPGGNNNFSIISASPAERQSSLTFTAPYVFGPFDLLLATVRSCASGSKIT